MGFYLFPLGLYLPIFYLHYFDEKSDPYLDFQARFDLARDIRSVPLSSTVVSQ